MVGAAHLGGKDLSLWMRCLSVRLPALPQLAFRHSASGWRPATTRPSSRPIWSPKPTATTIPNAAIEPRIPGIFQYYSIAEDELAKIFAGQSEAQEGADNIAAAWEKITDQIGRDNQIKLYKASLGM